MADKKVPKPKKKPVTPKEADMVRKSLKSADRANKGDDKLMGGKQGYKCGGKVKKKK